MLLLLLLLVVLVLFGVGISLHFLWILAAILLVFWLIGAVAGRGSSGRHHFYRW
jgi:hypothetical protein